MKYIYIKVRCLLFCAIAVNAQAQLSMIKGKITTSDGKAAAFVNITIKEFKQRVMSGEDGSFSINTAKECACSIIVSFAGLKTQEKKVTIHNGEVAEVNFQLEENSGELNEVRL